MTEGGEDLMLRLGDASLLKKKELRFEMLSLAAEAGLRVPRPFAFGTSIEG